MKSFASIKSPGSILAEIIMLSTTHGGGFLLVEGDDDSRFWNSRSSKSKCLIVISGGKDCSEEVALRLDARKSTRVIGVVDADFDRVLGRSLASPRLVLTDTHDLETMLIASRALDRYLGEFGNENDIYQYEKHTGMSVRESVLIRASEFAKLRLVSRIRNYQVNFANFSPHKYIDASNWQLDTVRLHRDFCIAAGIDPHVLTSALATLSVKIDWDMAQGHDALKVLAIGLRNHFGVCNNCGEKDIASRLRLSFDDHELQASALYQGLWRVLTRFGWSLT